MAYGILNPYRRSPMRARSGVGGGSLFDLHRQMNSLFEDLFDHDSEGGGTATMAAPMLDIHQDEKEIEITAELAGVSRDDIEITVNDGVLTICGEKRNKRDDSETGYRERSYGRFERRITLPQNVDEDRIEADYEDGVLTITMPKDEEKTRGRKIALGGKKKTSDNRAEDALIEQDDKSPQARERVKEDA